MLELINGKISPKGWILEHLLRDKSGICGNLDRLCDDASCGIFEDNKVKDEINGYWSSWWPGETEGNWRDAYIRLGFALEDEEIIKANRKYIDSILSHQGKDGYIGIFMENERFGNGARSGELWTQSRIINCLLSYNKGANDERIIPALISLIDLIVTKYGPLASGRSFYKIPDEDGSKAHGLMIVESILQVYEVCNKQEYLDFCEFLYEDYSNYSVDAKFPCYDISSIIASNPKEHFIGHGPHTCEQLRIPILLYQKTKKPIYKSIFISAFEKLKRYMSLSGSCKSDELIGAFQEYIPMEDRAALNFGQSFPIPGAGYEYCSTAELMFTFSKALNITMDFQYADFEEWMIMNAAMAARQQDGKAILYLCADNLYEATKVVGDRWDYSPTHIDAAVCCAPNSCKIMPYHLENMWLQNEIGELYAVYYGPSTVSTNINGHKIEIEEETIYPFENKICFTIKTKETLNTKLHFRIPSWCHAVKAEYNKNDFSDNVVLNSGGRCLYLQSAFNNNDKIIIEFICTPRILESIDGTKSVANGPLLYSLDIKTDKENYHSYDVDSFYDINYIPSKDADWNYTMILTNDDKLQHMQIENSIDENFVWDKSPISIKTVMISKHINPTWVELVPIGCTILRRTTFTSVKKQN